MTRFAAILALPILALATPAASMPTEVCAAMSEGAHSIMLARQRGASAATLLAVVAKQDGPIRDVYTAMIDDAFSAPQMSHPDNQIGAATEFAAKIYTVCRSDGV